MKNQSTPGKTRNLVVVFGDQLAAKASVFDDFDSTQDAVLMMEVRQEASYIPQHRLRLALFFSAMRHFRRDLERRGLRVHYSELDQRGNLGSFEGELPRWIKAMRPQRVIATQPGDHRVDQMLRAAARDCGCELEIRPDAHFIDSPAGFAEFADGRKGLLLETYYRHRRREHDILMHNGKPVGGRWNFDADNRESLGGAELATTTPPRRFRPDALTRRVFRMVEREFPDSPGTLEHFDYPVTASQARTALRDFIEHRLANFGRYQDAMMTGQPYLYHSRLSCVLNLHLLNPRDAISAAVDAYESGHAPLNSVEGFVRQLVGWREYVRGVYWSKMPGYADLNALNAQLPMPAFMWTAETEMNCVHQSVAQLIEHAYAHHIQRLMVLGLFALLLGVHPYRVHRWHMSMYADAVDWVSLPNVLGMSQYGDGGIVGTKPYCASGNYIQRMSNYCEGCRFNPKKASGDDACPITTLYWDFLARHEKRFASNPRMGFQLKNLARKDRTEVRTIRRQAEKLKTVFTEQTYDTADA